MEETSQVGFLIFLKNSIWSQSFESTLLKLEILMKLEAEHGGIRALFISTICTAKLRKYMAHDVVTWFSTSRDLQKRQMSTLTFFTDSR